MPNPILLDDLGRMHATVGRRDRFEGATIVVTGCAGFLGFYLMQYLVRYAGELRIRNVIGLDTFLLENPPWLNRLAEEFTHVLHVRAFDISKDDIATVEGASEARFVLHAASIAAPSFYRRYPIETIDANIWGLRKLLDFYKGRNTLKGFLFFSSSEIYGDPDARFVPTDEEYCGSVSCNGPRACYDESKRFGETLCWVYATQYEMPITVARPFNNYGPGMRLGDRRLPADLAKSVLAGEDLVILSDGKSTRTFCYVSDAVTGYFLCLLHGKYGYFNIGIDKPEIMVSELAVIYQEAGREIFGFQGQVCYTTSEDPEYLTDNPGRRCPIIMKARETLGYNPEVQIGEGVRRYLMFLKHEAGS
jgi:UDP-glucuronate decarboxylase